MKKSLFPLINKIGPWFIYIILCTKKQRNFQWNNSFFFFSKNLNIFMSWSPWGLNPFKALFFDRFPKIVIFSPAYPKRCEFFWHIHGLTFDSFSVSHKSMQLASLTIEAICDQIPFLFFRKCIASILIIYCSFTITFLVLSCLENLLKISKFEGIICYHYTKTEKFYLILWFPNKNISFMSLWVLWDLWVYE